MSSSTGQHKKSKKKRKTKPTLFVPTPLYEGGSFMPMNGERIEKLSLTSEPLGFMLAMKSSQSGDFQRMAERFASKAPWELLDFSPLAHTFNISLVEEGVQNRECVFQLRTTVHYRSVYGIDYCTTEDLNVLVLNVSHGDKKFQIILKFPDKQSCLAHGNNFVMRIAIDKFYSKIVEHYDMSDAFEQLCTLMDVARARKLSSADRLLLFTYFLPKIPKHIIFQNTKTNFETILKVFEAAGKQYEASKHLEQGKSELYDRAQQSINSLCVRCLRRLEKNGASHEELRDYLQRYIEVIRRYPYGYTLVNLFTKRVSTQKGSTLPNVLRSLVAIPEYDISYTDGLVGTITRRTKGCEVFVPRAEVHPNASSEDEIKRLKRSYPGQYATERDLPDWCKFDEEESVA